MQQINYYVLIILWHVIGSFNGIKTTGVRDILVINNDQDTLSLLKMWLEKKGYTVKYTEDAESVPDLIKEFRPKLVIVDILQRKIAEQLKNYENGDAFKVLLMTGYTLRSPKNALPVDDAIEKPFNLPLLERKINKLIEEAS